jgi:hypothetical protein
VRTAQKWEGEVSTALFCADCHAWAMALCQAQQIVCECSGWPLQDLWTEIAEFTREHLGYDPDREPDEDDEGDIPWQEARDPKLAGFTLRVDDGVGF